MEWTQFLALAICGGIVTRDALRSRRILRGSAAEDKSSVVLLVGVVTLAFCLSFFQLYTRPADLSGGVQVTGLILAACGHGLRSLAVAQMGEFFTWVLKVERGRQPLLTEGCFRVVRHPCYLGGYFEGLGLLLGLGMVQPVLLYLVGYTAALAFRVRTEEQMLAEAFGPAFESYRKRTAAVVPPLAQWTAFLQGVWLQGSLALRAVVNR